MLSFQNQHGGPPIALEYTLWAPPSSNLAGKLKTLSPERLAEVEDFIDFFTGKERGEAFGAFLSVVEDVTRRVCPS